MIAQLRGRVVLRRAGTVVIDVGGVGYLVHVTPTDPLPPPGEPVEVFTSLQVREESLTLYGFTDHGSLELFETLLTSSGVGPKLALAALATHRPAVLRAAIAGRDLPTLTTIPGVGKKVAERMVLELREKVGLEPADPGAGPAAATAQPGSPAVGEVRDALLGLGYSVQEAQAALAEVADGDEAEPSQLLRRALKVLAAGISDGSRR